MSVTRAMRKEIKCLEARRGKDASGLMAKVASELGFEAREAAKEQTGREGKTGGCTWGAQGRDSRSPMGLKDVWAVSFVDFDPVPSPLWVSVGYEYTPTGEKQKRQVSAPEALQRDQAAALAPTFSGNVTQGPFPLSFVT